MGWSVLDLSTVTDDLIALLNAAITGTSAWSGPNGTTIDKFPIQVSGSMPEADRVDAHGCLLSLYLLRACQSRSVFPQHAGIDHGERRPTRSQPLSLNLYYLLTAYAQKNYNHEQQAMSIALRCFHENPIIKRPPSAAHEPEGAEYIDHHGGGDRRPEMSRLWQAVSAPLRLGVVYKVSIVFVTSALGPVVDQPKPSALALAVSPQGASGAPTRLYGAASRDELLRAWTTPAADPDAVSAIVVPGLVRIGDTLIVNGTGLDVAAFSGVYLMPAGGVEQDVEYLEGTRAAPRRISASQSPRPPALRHPGCTA